MFARVAVVLGERENAILIPEQAIMPRGNNFFVYRIEDGRARLTKVQLGKRTPGKVEILDGLKPGAQVITEGQMKVFVDGTGVAVIAAPSPSPAPIPTASKPAAPPIK